MNEPAAPPSDDEGRARKSRKFNTRFGLVLFAIYLVLYLGFVMINAFAADVMERVVLAGLNLAIVYGFGLILVAVLLALVYGLGCRSETDDPRRKNAEVGR
jgi:uncharacterized membrane protein (DUF485 family)